MEDIARSNEVLVLAQPCDRQERLIFNISLRAEPYKSLAVSHETIAMGGTPMPQTGSPIVERLKTALRAQYEAIVNEPLPERWVDLIKCLNEQERAQRETCENKTRLPPRALRVRQ